MRVALLALAVVGCGRLGFDPVTDSATGTCPATDSTTSTYAEVVLSDHPAAYWRLDDATATQAADASGNHVTAAFEGANGLPTVGVAGALPLAANGYVADKAVAFANYATLDAGPVFAFTGSVPYSIEAWMHASQGAGFQALCGVVARNTAGSPLAGYFIELEPATGSDSTGIVFLREYALGSADSVAATWPATTWTHVVAVYDGSEERIYVNGALGSSSTSTAIPSSSDDFWIATDGGAGYSPLDGTLDEMAVYTYALPAARVLAHYQAGTL